MIEPKDLMLFPELEVQQFRYSLKFAWKIIEALDVSPASKRAYKAAIKHFIDFITLNGLSATTHKDYKNAVRDMPLATSTKNRMLSAAWLYLLELRGRKILEFDIIHAKAFKAEKKHTREGLTTEEVIQIKSKIDTIPDLHTRRQSQLLYCLAALQGLRACEINRLRWEDINLIDGYMMVLGKARDDKEMVYLSAQTSLAFENARRYRDTGYIFSSTSGRTPVSRKTIYRRLKEFCSFAGTGKSGHAFRHFFITSLLSKMDLRDVRKLSRHKSLDMLIVYDDELETRSLRDKADLIHQTLSV